MHTDGESRSIEQAADLLELATTASESEIRSAYLRQVQAHPPDREPELFEQIRDAYEQMRDPSVRARAILHGPDPNASLTTLVDGKTQKRKFVGSQLWIELLKENRT